MQTGSAQLPYTFENLTKVPGAGIYMPPEAFTDDPQYGLPLDIFSFGVVALFTLAQSFPAHVEPQVYRDPLGRFTFRSEFERNENTLHSV